MNPLEIASVLFEQGWNRRNFAEVRGLLSDEFPLHIGADTYLTNAEEFETIVNGWHAAFPDFRFEVHSITADDHLAAVRATLHGTHHGPWDGLPATGRSVAVEHAFFLAIEGRVIVEVWEILDRSAFRAQLGTDGAT